MHVLIATVLESADQDRLKAAFPDVDFRFADGKEEAAESILGCTVMLGSSVTSEILERADSLKWIQTRSAGVNALPFEELSKRGITVTNSSGAHGVPIAENLLAMMLAFATGLHLLIPAQTRREWVADSARDKKFELEGQILLTIGLGDLGATLACKARSLRMHVLGIRRRNLDPPEGVDELIPPDRLLEALPRADHVALCLPLTAETTRYIAEPQLRAMKSTAYLYNAGRGKSIDRDALLRALNENWIAGAGLDVTDPEPLPPDDPLWRFPNVLLTQHTSGSSPQNSRRVTDLFIANLQRYLKREDLQNLVDLNARY